MTFNPNDRKYHSCCCYIHVTTLASLFMSFFVCSITLDLWRSVAEAKFLSFLFLPVLLLGVYGLCQESRIALFAFIGLSILACVTRMILIIANAISDERFKRAEYEEEEENAFLIAVLSCLILVLFMVPFVLVIWSLTQFIKDREAADKVIERCENV
ncbi:hypothetical protein PMAYCL1PPCAC_22923 [Pristionchus mayeri]|uniref:Uncharacterized protein n=1 Tax=Pristionchus mayeri TaxID=1317129 RepID=A0AAN5CXG8_9BILA|nr:hypothetical protein PMAYCL1PPCAC_22923 [Pristionchus mayeri]